MYAGIAANFGQKGVLFQSNTREKCTKSSDKWNNRTLSNNYFTVGYFTKVKGTDICFESRTKAKIFPRWQCTGRPKGSHSGISRGGLTPAYHCSVLKCKLLQSLLLRAIMTILDGGWSCFRSWTKLTENELQRQFSEQMIITVCLILLTRGNFAPPRGSGIDNLHIWTVRTYRQRPSCQRVCAQYKEYCLTIQLRPGNF